MLQLPHPACVRGCARACVSEPFQGGATTSHPQAPPPGEAKGELIVGEIQTPEHRQEWAEVGVCLRTEPAQVGAAGVK